MVLSWLLRWRRRARRRRLLATPMPPDWRPILQRLPFYGRLDPGGRARLEDDLRVLVAEKEWEGCGGLELTDEIRVTIAAQAALLLLGRRPDEHDYYRNVAHVLVYPSTYRAMPMRGADGVVREGQAHLGEAWSRGPVVLSWDAAKGGALDPDDGKNLVLHEFAHKLDMLDGLADGTPPLADTDRFANWVRVMTAEFDALRAASQEDRATLLDTYGATNPAEFFAVATECFFECGAELRQRHPELYAALMDYYGQDPAAA